MGKPKVLSGYGDTTSASTTTSNEKIVGIKALSDRMKSKFQKEFVNFFRHASPYIEGHRGKVVVICVPGEVIADIELCNTTLDDIAMLNLLGVKIILVLGAHSQIE